MAEAFCTLHSTKQAVGYCSRCNNPYCADCLDMEMGKPICVQCLKKSPAFDLSSEPAKTPSPASPMAGSSPLNFKGKGLDDDPLGLFGAGGPPKMEPPKLNPLPNISKPPMPSMPAPPRPSQPEPAFGGMSMEDIGLPQSPMGMPPPSDSSMKLNSIMKETQPLRPPFPSASKPDPAPAPEPSSSVNAAAQVLDAAKKKMEVFKGGEAWERNAFGRFYDSFGRTAARFKLPVLVFAGILAVLVVGVIVWWSTSSSEPGVPLVDSIQPIHMIQVNAAQINELDVTAYSDLQNQVQAMGFKPILQMTIPQLPSTNFFDVSMKEDSNTYGEILKLPGQITPHLSFVTVFSDGVWFSTNGWQGTNQTMEYLVSEFYPNDTPDQLLVQHMQTLEKLKQKNGDPVTSLSQNLYMTALSDHLRWFLSKKGIEAYQADFAMWH